jgi:hypothetical protein
MFYQEKLDNANNSSLLDFITTAERISKQFTPGVIVDNTNHRIYKCFVPIEFQQAS